MGSLSKTAMAFVMFCTISSLATLTTTTEAEATTTRVTNLMQKAKLAPAKPTSVIRKNVRKRKIYRKRKISGHFRRPSIPHPVEFGVGSDDLEDDFTLGVPNVCSLSWHEVGDHGYRKVTCKHGYKARFPAHRPWAYENFSKTHTWRQSRSWGGRFYPHNLYQGNLEATDHGRKIQGDPFQYLNPANRYQQSSQFSQKIYYPPAPWQ